MRVESRTFAVASTVVEGEKTELIWLTDDQFVVVPMETKRSLDLVTLVPPYTGPVTIGEELGRPGWQRERNWQVVSARTRLDSTRAALLLEALHRSFPEAFGEHPDDPPDTMGPEIDDEDGLSDWQAEVYDDQEGDP